MKNNHNSQQDIQLARLTTRFDEFEKNFYTFRTNEFRHLANKVEGLNNKITYGFIVMIAATLLLQVVLKLF